MPPIDLILWASLTSWMSLAQYFFCYTHYMGSGQGKSRRVQAVDPWRRAKKEEYKDKNWSEFTKNNGLDDVTLYEYYLGEGASQYSKDDAIAKVLSELLADAIVLGEVALPVPYTAADFEFQISSGAPHGWVNRAAKIVLKSAPKLKARRQIFPVVFSDKTEMGHHYVNMFFDEVSEGIRMLLEERADLIEQYEALNV